MIEIEESESEQVDNAESEHNEEEGEKIEEIQQQMIKEESSSQVN